MKIKKINISIFLVTLLSVVVLSFGISEKSFDKKYQKIIKFNHQVHSEDVACSDCHSDVSEMEVLNDDLLPPQKEICAGCHDVDDDENCTMCHYEDVFEPLDYIPGEIIFSHKKHAVADKCEKCHVDKINEEIFVGNPAMNYCYNCHKDSRESVNECSVCHKTNDNLVPEFHNRVDFAKDHSSYQMQKCAMCHSEEFCGECHEAVGLSINGDLSNSYSILSPATTRNPNKMFKLQKVHSMDYRFTHGIDARGKVNDCYTCHQSETFCVECHEANGLNPGGNSLLPLSHLVGNFVTIGVGTGGGDHAKLARNDIESCASCHDTQGGDPNCILCHIDPDGIKGTNPRTHPGDFNFDGDFHNSKGSVCYNCHTDPNARPNGVSGQGFCGYCHSSK